MRISVVGGGSIVSRPIGNLKTIGDHEVFLLDPALAVKDRYRNPLNVLIARSMTELASNSQ